VHPRSNPFRQHSQVFPYAAAQVSRTLGGSGTANGSGWFQARCPNHADHRFSLSLKDTAGGGLIAKCFVCRNAVEVEAAIRARMDGQPVMIPPVPAQLNLSPARISHIIARIRAGCTQAAGTLAERYAEHRGIAIRLPPTLLYHPALYHQESRTSGPAMVALVDGADAIHRTWIAADGTGKADMDPAKKSLGPTKGHAVHLGRPAPRLIVGEGIETTLSALQLWGPSGFDAWATLSTSGMAALVVPDTVNEVLIAADNDAAGRQAAWDLRTRLNRERPTLPVSVYLPRNGEKDFNDVLKARAVA
jgi:hypothetical protein